MNYKPITNENKQSWLRWLRAEALLLDGKEESKESYILETPDGDVASVKDLVGTMLATLTNETITIN